jgi:signal transduction histidine kinase
MMAMNDPFSSGSSSDNKPQIKDFDWIEVFNLGGFITDQSWKIISWNQSFLEILGLETKKDLKNLDVFVLLGLQDYKPDLKNEEIKSLAFTVPGTENTLLLRTRNISKDGEGYRLGILSSNNLDIMDEEWCNRFQNHLIRNQQNHILEKRLEGLIHNINTPLNTIIGYVQILLRENPESKALQKIMESGFQIDSSLKSIQDKIGSNRSRFKQQIDVNRVIQNELEIGRNDLFFKHNVHVDLVLADSLPLIYMVYGDLSYCLDAVLWNAIESLHEQETKNLNIETKLDGQRIQIMIKDTGCGISAKDIPFIYEYGFTTKKKQNNEHLGLGLSFTRQVIQDYRGNIIIDSEPRVGTTVTIDLPLEDIS